MQYSRFALIFCSCTRILKNVSLSFFCRIISWREEHDFVFCREIIFVNPFSTKRKSVQRSALWQKMADTLNSITDPLFFWINAQCEIILEALVQRFKRKEAR